MNSIFNTDLFFAGIIIAANLIIGFVVILSDKKSATNKLFLSQTIILSLWSAVNYASYQSRNSETALMLVRAVLFLGIPNSVNFLLLMHTFPSRNISISKRTLYLLGTVTIITMCLTMTPFVFKGVVFGTDSAPAPIPAPGIIAFIILAILPVLIGIFYLVSNYRKAAKQDKKKYLPLILGIGLMFFLIFFLAIIFPVFLGSSRFIPLSAAFTFPFVVLTAYSIYKHGLFNIKIATTLILSIFVTTFSFINIIFSKEPVSILMNVTAFLIILLGSFRLIHDTLRLEQANEKLRELDKQKSEFVSFASHQLRSPLTAMKGYSSLLLEGDYGEINPPAREAVQRIYDSTNTLTNVVNDYLDITRIELGTMKYNFANIDLRDLTTQVIAELKPTIEKSGLKLNYDVFHNDHYMVKADKDKLKQVIANLIDNSFKYTPKGSVLVTIERKDSNVRLSIKDTGIGMSAETIPKLFEKFVRASTSNMAEIKGTGLGLFVAKEIVVSHGGRIWAESKGEGKGSEFYVELPIVGGVK